MNCAFSCLNYQTIPAASLLHVWICCNILSYMIGNRIYLGFGLLVRKNKQFGEVSMGSHYLLVFYRKINESMNKQLGNCYNMAKQCLWNELVLCGIPHCTTYLSRFCCQISSLMWPKWPYLNDRTRPQFSSTETLAFMFHVKTAGWVTQHKSSHAAFAPML